MIFEDQNAMALFIILEKQLTFDKTHEYLKLCKSKEL